MAFGECATDGKPGLCASLVPLGRLLEPSRVTGPRESGYTPLLLLVLMDSRSPSESPVE